MKFLGRDVLALLMMPPPVHGASAINQAMVRQLETHGIPVRLVNTVPSAWARWFNSPIWRMLRALVIAKAFLYIILRYFIPPKCVYIGISGGSGLLFDCLLALAIRHLGSQVVVHHHSFSYVSKNNALFRRFCSLLASVSVTHVVLCSEMGEQLCSLYPDLITKDQVFVLSNAAFFAGRVSKNVSNNEQHSLRIGFIANITPDKGIYDVISLFEACRQAGLKIQMVIAGSCADSSIRNQLEMLSVDSEAFIYLGAVYGEHKQSFYNSLDVLVFPTRYANEAEPLIIYEAAEHGVPTIANARGCIASMVVRCGGWVVKDETQFVAEAMQVLCALQASSAKDGAKKCALAGSDYLRGASQGALNELLAKMGANRVSTA